MINNSHEVVEGAQEQTSDEEVVRKVTTTPWGSSPTSQSAKAYDEDINEDVTSTVIAGNCTVSDDVITLPTMKALEKGHSYRVEVKFTCSGNVLECFFKVKCTK